MRTLEELIAAANCNTNFEITSANFPGADHAIFSDQLEVIDFGTGLGIQEVVKIIKGRGFRPATIFEGFDFAARNPEAQRESNIVIPEEFSIRGVNVVLFFGADFNHGRLVDLTFSDTWCSKIYDKVGLLHTPCKIRDKFLVSRI